MCGIAAVALGHRDRSRRTLDRIWDRFTTLFLCAQQRGLDASGVAVLCTDGHLQVVKAPVESIRLVRSTRYEGLRRLLPRAAVLLGHARHVTKGPVTNPDNNHPIFAGRHLGPDALVVGVHNGRVLNDDALCEAHAVPRLAEVDSEVLFQLVAEAHQAPHPRERLRAVFEELRGPTSGIWILPGAPERCFIARVGSPLAYAFDDAEDVVYMASLQPHLAQLLGPGIEACTFSDDQIYRLDLTRPELGWPWEYSQARSFYSRISELTFEDLRAIAQARAEWRVQDEALPEVPEALGRRVVD